MVTYDTLCVGTCIGKAVDQAQRTYHWLLVAKLIIASEILAASRLMSSQHVFRIFSTTKLSALDDYCCTISRLRRSWVPEAYDLIAQGQLLGCDLSFGSSRTPLNTRIRRKSGRTFARLCTCRSPFAASWKVFARIQDSRVTPVT